MAAGCCGATIAGGPGLDWVKEGLRDHVRRASVDPRVPGRRTVSFVLTFATSSKWALARRRSRLSVGPLPFLRSADHRPNTPRIVATPVLVDETALLETLGDAPQAHAFAEESLGEAHRRREALAKGDRRPPRKRSSWALLASSARRAFRGAVCRPDSARHQLMQPNSHATERAQATKALIERNARC